MYNYQISFLNHAWNLQFRNCKNLLCYQTPTQKHCKTPEKNMSTILISCITNNYGQIHHKQLSRSCNTKEGHLCITTKCWIQSILLIRCTITKGRENRLVCPQVYKTKQVTPGTRTQNYKRIYSITLKVQKEHSTYHQ